MARPRIPDDPPEDYVPTFSKGSRCPDCMSEHTIATGKAWIRTFREFYQRRRCKWCGRAYSIPPLNTGENPYNDPEHPIHKNGHAKKEPEAPPPAPGRKSTRKTSRKKPGKRRRRPEIFENRPEE